MVTMHWLLEYAAVLCGYVFLLFIWPSVVFRRHLAGKSKVYWFGFCVCVQMVLVNTVVLLFGLVHILNKWTILLFFYGVFLVTLLRPIKINMGTVETVRYLVMGVYGKKRLFLEIVSFLRDKLKKLWTKLWATVYPHFGEYALLAVLLIFGMIYFSYGAFQDPSYGFSDMYVHHSWIYGLMEGKIFSAGVYPEGMHCFIYCLRTLFGIPIYSSMIFIGGIHIAVMLLSAYILFREVFYWGYTPLFVLAMFLVLDVTSARLQCALPQDFGMYTEFLCALYLIRYLKYSHQIVWKNKTTRFYWDENIFLLIMAIAASISIHFYATIMAFFICMAVALCSIWKVFSRKRFIPLIAAVLCGLLIAVLPMAGALLSGIQFQGSIGWAVGVINGSANEETQSQEIEEDVEEDIGEAENSVAQTRVEWGKEIVATIYNKGYLTRCGDENGKWAAALTCFSALLWIIFRASAFLVRTVFKKKVDSRCLDNYPAMILASFLFAVAYAAPSLGLPELVQIARLGVTANMLLLSVIVMPVDMLFSLIAWRSAKKIFEIVSICCTIGIYIGANYLGIYHGYLSYEITRYKEAVMVTESIIQTFPQNSYTIVSPTDELYQVIEYGRHEELLTFVNDSQEKEEYTLPTQYVFLYIEKRALDYAHVHIFNGPSWLAKERGHGCDMAARRSYCPAVCGAEISEEAAQQELVHKENPWHMYTQLESRIVLESKAYEWCKRFSKLYPLELNTYYEDDNFVCYYFVQEPHALYNLAIE